VTVEAWESIEKNALWALEHAADLSPREPVEGRVPLLRVWEYRSKGTYTAWTVLSSIGTQELGRPTVREVVWKRDQDEKHLASVDRKNKLRTKQQTTIRVRDAEVFFQDLRPFMEAAARLFVPAIAPQNPNLEGSSGIEGYHTLTWLRMDWRGSGPVEWAETIRWVGRLRKLLEASLEEREETQG
jgi:hypothetical protein